MNYSLEQLRMFVLVADLGSFSEAARRLGKAQSSLSSAIANLEIDLGFKLFHREGKYPSLTEQGAKIRKSVDLVLEQNLQLINDAQQINAAPQTSMTIAVEVPYLSIIEPLSDFAAQFPHIDIRFRTPERGEIIELLRDEKIHLAINFAQTVYPPDIHFHQLGKLILTHVAHRDHPLARLKNISFLQLRTHRRLSLSSHKNQLPSTQYLNSKHIWEGENYLALLTLVKAQLGWATLPRQMILEEIKSGELIELPLEAYPHTDWITGVDLLWSKNASTQEGSEWLKKRLLRHKMFELDSSGNSTTL